MFDYISPFWREISVNLLVFQATMLYLHFSSLIERGKQDSWIVCSPIQKGRIVVISKSKSEKPSLDLFYLYPNSFTVINETH
jgi:hypothetical protein